MSIDVIKDLRPLFGGARDQGGRPTCVAFAFSDTHAALRDNPEEMSAEHLHYLSVKRDPSGRFEEAAVPFFAVQALKQDGQCLEAGWPYLVALPSNLRDYRPPPTATPAYRRNTENCDPKFDQVVDALDNDRPAVLTVLLGQRFYEPKRGIVLPGPNDEDTDYHAVVAVGYGEKDAERVILIRNSWGTDWGENGYAWLTEPYLAPRLHEASLISLKELV